MKLRSLAILFGLALTTGAASAQIGIYVMPAYARVSGTADTGTFAFLGPNKTSANFKGANMGIYYDFSHSGNVGLGLDMRLRILGSSTGARQDTFLVGIRAVYTAPERIHPYIEPFVGVAGTHSGTNPLWLKRAEYGGLAGVDYRLGKHADFRAVEFSYSSFQPINTDAFGISPTQHKATNFSAASGIVLRF
jgi:hypothetical protein